MSDVYVLSSIVWKINITCQMYMYILVLCGKLIYLVAYKSFNFERLLWKKERLRYCHYF